MQDANGRYVQKKNIFGIWRNWLIHHNCTTSVGRNYYDCSADIIDNLVTETNKPKPKPKDVLLKEFTV